MKRGKAMKLHIFCRSYVGEKPCKWQFVHVIIGLLLVAGISCGCGSGGESASKGAGAVQPLKACELLTKADVEAALGVTVDEPLASFQENKDIRFWMSQCSYYSKNPESPKKGRGVGLMIQNSRNADPVKALEDYTASLKKALGDAYNAQTIDGVGARAVWNGSVKQLTIFEGSYMLIVSMVSPGQEERVVLETAKTLAKKVLSKLPQ